MPNIITELYESAKERLTSMRQLTIEVSKWKSAYWDLSQMDPYNPDSLVEKKGLDTYEKMQTDDQVRAVTQMRKNAVLSTGYDIMPADESVGAKEIAQFVQFNLCDNLDSEFDQDVEEILTCWEFGFSVTEKNFRYIDRGRYEGKVGYKNFKTRAPHSMEFRPDVYGNLEKLIQFGDVGEEIPLDPKKFVIMTHNGKFGNWYGESDLRSAYRAWYSKALIIRFWNIFLERFGVPPVLAHYPPGFGKAERTNIYNMLKNLQAKSIGVLPDGVTADILEVRQRGDAGFKDAIDKYNTSIARCMLLPDLLGYSGSKGGTYNLGEKQLDIFKLTLAKLRKRVENVINKQIIRPLVDINFGNVDLYPKIKYKPLTEDSQYDMLDLWIKAIEKGAVTPTEEDEAKVREVLNMPKRNPEDTPLNPAQKKTGKNPDIPEEKEEESGEIPEKGEFKHFWDGTPFHMARAKTTYEEKVDFRRVASDMNKEELSTMLEIGKIIGLMKEELLASIRKKGIIETKDAKAIETLTLRHLTDMRIAWKMHLRDQYDLGRKHAKAEAKKEGYATVTVGNLPPKEALEYLDAKAFKLTGTEKDYILKGTKDILYSGLRHGDSEAQVKYKLEEFFEQYKVQQKLPNGKLEDIEKIEGRLNVLVRTNFSDAYNQGRLITFQDPDLEGFIVAYQYSAIMDKRTTDFCASYDGRIYKASDPIIAKYNPPNHHQCRSIWVPILAGEQHNINKPLAIQPGKGFGGVE